MGVDVGADDETDDVEEGHPGGLGEELLGECQRDGGDDPADLHDRPEAGLDRGLDLVEGARTGDKGHGDEVDAVLDGRDLGRVRRVVGVQEIGILTTKLLTKICITFALRLLRPWKIFWRALIKT